MAKAISKEMFFKAWESQRKEFALLVNQINLDDPLWKELYDWYEQGRDLVAKATEHVYPEGEE